MESCFIKRNLLHDWFKVPKISKTCFKMSNTVFLDIKLDFVSVFALDHKSWRQERHCYGGSQDDSNGPRRFGVHDTLRMLSQSPYRPAAPLRGSESTLSRPRRKCTLVWQANTSGLTTPLVLCVLQGWKALLTSGAKA